MCVLQVPEMLLEDGIEVWSRKEDAAREKVVELSWDEMREQRQKEARLAMERAKERDRQKV